MDDIHKCNKVILLGFGHFGSTVGRFLRAHGVDVTILESDSNRVDFLRQMGFEVYYGDATRIDLLESAGIAEADFLISAIDNPDSTVSLMKKLKEKYPKVKLMVRAKNRYDAYELHNMGIENIYRESLDTSVKLASDVLHFMGFDKEATNGQAQKFIRLDVESLKRLAVTPKEDKEYIFRAREEIAQQEKLLIEDLKIGNSEIGNNHASNMIERKLKLDKG